MRVRGNPGKLIVILCFILLFFLAYLLGTLKRTSIKEKKIEDTLQSMPLYLHISTSEEKVSRKLAVRYINVVRQQRLGTTGTYEDELSFSFPSVPRENRRWECHRHDGVVYVCYVLRTGWTEPAAFVWKIRDDGSAVSFTPENEEARIMDGIASANPQELDSIRRMHAPERQVVEFFYDRDFFVGKDPELGSYCRRVAARKFGISMQKIEQILHDYTVNHPAGKSRQ